MLAPYTRQAFATVWIADLAVKPKRPFTKQLSLSCLACGFEATGADVLANLFATFPKSCLLNIRFKLALRFALRKTYIVAGHWSLATYLTFSHNSTLGEDFIIFIA